MRNFYLWWLKILRENSGLNNNSIKTTSAIKKIKQSSSDETDMSNQLPLQTSRTLFNDLPPPVELFYNKKKSDRPDAQTLNKNLLNRFQENRLKLAYCSIKYTIDQRFPTCGMRVA